MQNNDLGTSLGVVQELVGRCSGVVQGSFRCRSGFIRGTSTANRETKKGMVWLK